jgi:hypothetical protein
MLEEVKELKNVVIANPELKELMLNPRFSKEEHLEILGKVFKGKIDDRLFSFLELITVKGRYGYLDEILDYFILRVKEYLHIGQAKDIIPSLPDGIGLAYVDADKENYDEYYSLLLPKMKKGGIMLLDNMLWYGRVVEEEAHTSPSTSELRCQREARLLHQLNNRITLDERVENILLPLRDGIMMCLVR